MSTSKMMYEPDDGPGDVEPPASSGSALSRDTVFFALSNQRRRYVVHYLEQQSAPVLLRELTMQVAAWENDIAAEDVTYKQRKTVYTSLRQTHLPMLERAGIVDCDESGDNITLADRAADLDPYLRPAEQSGRRPWQRAYLGLGVLASLLVAVGWLDVYPVGLVPDIVLAAVVAGSFTAIAALQTIVRDDA